MNVSHFDEGTCQKVRRYLDSYVNNELLVATYHDVLRHLEGCPACSAEFEARVRLKRVVHDAVQQQSVSPDLEAKVRRAIREKVSRPSMPALWSRWGWR